MSESCHTHTYASTPTCTNMYNFGHTLCLNLNNNLILTTGFMFRVQKSQEFSFLFFHSLGSQGIQWTIFTAVETRILRTKYLRETSLNIEAVILRGWANRSSLFSHLCPETQLWKKSNFLTWRQKGFSGNKKVMGDQGRRRRSLGEEPYKFD